MGTSFISALFVGITVLIVFMILLVVLLFVGVGAYRLIAARKALSAIDFSDGLDESEIQIIRNALLKKQTADKEAAVKAKGKGRGSMVFLTEGQSAAGSIVSTRDVNTQAIFVLKGKPLNVWDLKRDIVYKNDEMYNLMRALDIEDNIDGLRYSKVILATDADVDGLHIRNLLITYFYRFFEQLVHDGHLYVLETPLFRVRNKQETIYCYSEAERDTAVTKLGKTSETTRFKGLGEISPAEFKQFIGDDMRLSQVEYAIKTEAATILSFYMGKNTPERKDYIMENLVVPVED